MKFEQLDNALKQFLPLIILTTISCASLVPELRAMRHSSEEYTIEDEVALCSVVVGFIGTMLLSASILLRYTLVERRNIYTYEDLLRVFNPASALGTLLCVLSLILYIGSVLGSLHGLFFGLVFYWTGIIAALLYISLLCVYVVE